jgi:hypothetical protein
VIIIEAKLLLTTIVEANTGLKQWLGMIHMYGCCCRRRLAHFASGHIRRVETLTRQLGFWYLAIEI